MQISTPGLFKQTLLGYSPDATTSTTLDREFDAGVITTNAAINLYTLATPLSTDKLTIQGRYLASPFNKEDVVPLGFSCPIGVIEIRTSEFDGIFSGNGQSYLLREDLNENGIDDGDWVYHDIKNTPYTFETSSSIANNTTRFAIVFGNTVELKLNIEGYYDVSTHNMKPVKYNQGTSSDTNEVCDLIVELRDPVTYAFVAASSPYLLTNSSTAIANFPVGITGDYYIKVKHRNAIETWSANPVTIVNGSVFYDFTDAANKAYGDNQVQVEPGVFAFYSGDIDQDGFVDISDYSLWEVYYYNGAFGDNVTDLDGDGFIDINDYSIWENNFINSIYSVHP